LLFEAGNDEEDLNDLFDTYQSKKLQTADDKVVKKEKEKTEETVPTITLSTAEILKREAYSRTTENDFLLDMGEYEIPNIETTIDILEEKPTYTTAHYFGKELLNIINLETTMKDIFVLPPEKRNAKKLREGAGYLLTKLKTIESYYVTQQCFKYNIPMNVNYYTIGNFLTNLNLLLGMIDYCEEKMDFSSLKWLVIILYKLLCKSFLSQNNHDLDEKSFFVLKGEIILYLKKEKKSFKETQIQNLMKKSLLLNYTKEDNYLYIKVNYQLFEKQFNKDILINIEKKQSLLTSIFLDGKLNEIYANFCKEKENIYDELINQI